MIESVVIIGSGNLATQLARALSKKGIDVKQVYSRTLEAAKELAAKVNAGFTNDISRLAPDADLYIIAVKDAAIQEVLMNLSPDPNRMIVHTAGSVSMEALSSFTHHYGVFYPLQTFSKYREVNFSELPICIEANDSMALFQLQELAQTLSSSVHLINSEERKTLHLAAVFVNNFVNHLYVLGAEVLHNQKLDFNLLKPLIHETAAKIETMHPMEAQTGPASRNDHSIISAQLKMLQDRPEFQKIYHLMTESIYHIHQKQNHDLL